MSYVQEQYQRAMREAKAQREALAATAVVASDEFIELEVNPDGTVARCLFTESARDIAPGRLAASFMRVQRTAQLQSREAMVATLQRTRPDIAAAVQEHEPQTAGEDESRSQVTTRPVAAAGTDRADDQTPEEFPPPPKTGVEARWAQIRAEARNPIAAINAAARDPELTAARPKGDPKLWNQQARERITAIVERGRALMPQLQTLTGHAASDLVEVTVNLGGAPTGIEFRRQLGDRDLGEVADEVVQVLGQAHADVKGQADRLLEGVDPGSSWTTDAPTGKDS